MIFRLLCSSDLTTKLEVYKPPLLQPSSFPYLVGEGFGDFKICGGSESSYLLHLSEALSIFKPGNLETVVEVFGLFLKIEVISDREGRGEMTATFTMTTKAPSLSNTKETAVNTPPSLSPNPSKSLEAKKLSPHLDAVPHRLRC
jgi:hypothetical protein